MFDGRLPSNTRCGTSQSGVPSAFTCSARLAEGQRFGLREARSRAACRGAGPSGLSGLRERDEVARDEPRALVDQLVERVLAVGAGLAPVDRAGVVVDARRRRASRACRCSPSSAAAGRPGSASGTARTAARATVCAPKKVVVPDGEQPHAAPAGCARTARVRKCSSICVEAVEHRAEVLRADREHRRQADRRVHRVAAADPVPEAEHVRGVDAELRRPSRRWSTRRRSAWPPAFASPPSPASDQSRALLRVGHRLERRERLRRDDEQRLGRVEVARRPRRSRCRRRSTRSGTSASRSL